MNNLPVTSQIPVDEFVGEFQEVDLSSLKDKTYCLAVSTGDRNSCKALASTIHGPYSFYEMVEETALMWRDQQHHAKVFILEKDQNLPTTFLDQNTVDFIEAKWDSILAESLIDNTDKEYTAVARPIVDTSDQVTEA